MPGADRIRLGPDGIRRPDQCLTFATDDGAIVMLRSATLMPLRSGRVARQ
jgi:hypothetical protein